MVDELEEKVRFWTPIEKEVLSKPVVELKDEMLEHLKFIYDNFGTPKEWYTFSNPKQDEINRRIDRLQDIRRVLLHNIDKTQSLYDMIVKENGKTKSTGLKEQQRDFAKFYMTLRESFLFSYGEPKLSVGSSTPGIFHPYSDLKNTIRWLAMCLEKGPTNVQDLIEKYAQQAGKQPDQPYTG